MSYETSVPTGVFAKKVNPQMKLKVFISMLNQHHEVMAAANYLFKLLHPIVCGQMDCVEEVSQGRTLDHLLL